MFKPVYLNDSDFLKEIDKMKIKEQYIKITVLDFQERPVQEIQGKVISGNISLDGRSSIRRTCNLTMVADEISNNLSTVNGSVISMNKKIRLEIGLINNTLKYKEYEKIWFPLGVYVIINSSLSRTTGGITISLQLKDKMCLLNGECGGRLPSSVVLHEYDTIDENGNYVIKKPIIYQIIQELVNHFGGEQLGKIIISDIDTRIRQVMKWTGSSPLYIIEEAGDISIQYTPTTNMKDVETAGGYFKQYNYGDDIGYVYTDFTFPGELIADAGSSICDVLDKIKNVLGNYEYFYDLDGNFVFQEIKNYLNTTQAKIELDKMNKDNYLVDFSKGKSVYTFDNSILITSFSNSPQYSNIKNDFVIWGMKNNASGASLPIRYHLVIDEKPKIGNEYLCFKYKDENDGLEKMKCPPQAMYESKNDFPIMGVKETFYMDKNTNKIYIWNSETKDYDQIETELQRITTKDWRTEYYLSGASSEFYAVDSNYYYAELLNEWPKLYDVESGDFYPEVLKAPSDIDYFLDFLDSSSALSEFSVNNIGRRSYVVVNDKINCVFEPEIPNYILLEEDSGSLEAERAECLEKGEDFIQLPQAIYQLIASGGTFNSAYNLVRELLYESTSYNECISITSLPIYYLEPNVRITVEDSVSGIFGDYMINSISLSLGINSVMSLSCNRALERF